MDLGDSKNVTFELEHGVVDADREVGAEEDERPSSLLVYNRKGFSPFVRNQKATEREVQIWAGTGITAGTPKGVERG